MANFLVFQLYGALASWGDIAVGEYRPTHQHPSKSAIMGLVAASLGIKRQEESTHLKMGESYGFAIYTRSVRILRDYHTSQFPRGNHHYFTRKDELSLPDKLNTILSQRDYCTDFFYKVALWVNNSGKSFTLEEIKTSLEFPKFCLYLGRKSCPLGLPTFPVIFKDISLKKAIDSYSNEFQSKVEKNTMNHSSGHSHYYWEGGLTTKQLGMSPIITYVHRDQIKSRKRWQFSNRKEFHYYEEEMETE